MFAVPVDALFRPGLMVVVRVWLNEVCGLIVVGECNTILRVLLCVGLMSCSNHMVGWVGSSGSILI